ncbi:hypothetical protein IWZ01DRAFT_478889 [Phyllosticta capitalensis]
MAKKCSMQMIHFGFASLRCIAGASPPKSAFGESDGTGKAEWSITMTSATAGAQEKVVGSLRDLVDVVKTTLVNPRPPQTKGKTDCWRRKSLRQIVDSTRHPDEASSEIVRGPPSS